MTTADHTSHPWSPHGAQSVFVPNLERARRRALVLRQLAEGRRLRERRRSVPNETRRSEASEVIQHHVNSGPALGGSSTGGN